MLNGLRPLLAVLCCAALAWAGIDWLGLREGFRLAALRELLTEHRLGGLLAFSLLFAIGNLAQIPGGVFLAAAVLTFGRTWGGIATYLAASFACLAGFVTIRAIGGGALRRIDHALARRILDRLDLQPVRSVFYLRLLFQTMPAMNYALAMSGVRLRHLLLGTVLGLPLPIAIYCVFFDTLARLLGIAPA